MRRKNPRSKKEPTIALINVVFLMLVFFMVAGTLSPPLDPDLNLVDTRTLEGAPPPDALVLHADGRLSFRGVDQPDAAAFMETLEAEARRQVRIVPDRDVNAETLVRVGRVLTRSGAERVLIVTERGLQ